LPVFVDGRADVYGDDFLFYYLKSFAVMEDWRRPLDDFNVEYVLMEKGSALSSLLAISEFWEEAYVDDVAQIFVRTSQIHGTGSKAPFSILISCCQSVDRFTCPGDDACAGGIARPDLSLRGLGDTIGEHKIQRLAGHQ
jgi:hypothetical protein